MFSIDLKKPENYAGSSAPVHYPRIWNTPWFDWVQYNGSIMQPMVRNAGESLGVSAELNLTDPSKGLLQIERGRRQSPRDGADDQRRQAAEREGRLFGPEVAEMAEGHPAARSTGSWRRKGGELYKTHCQECHRPPVVERGAF